MARSNPGSTGPGAFLAQSLLADPALCGWRPELITVIANPISAADLADRIADLAETTIGVLLLYYVGHGVLSTRGELCLTVTSTRPNRRKSLACPGRYSPTCCVAARPGLFKALRRPRRRFPRDVLAWGPLARARRTIAPFGLTSPAGCCA